MDGSGLFLTPGLIDSHVHLGAIPGMTPEQEAEHPDIARAVREQIPRSFLALRLHDSDRSDLDPARDGALEKPRHRSDTSSVRRPLMDGLRDELRAKAANAISGGPIC